MLIIFEQDDGYMRAHFSVLCTFGLLKIFRNKK